MDLVDASPLVGLGPKTFAVGHATLKIKSGKWSNTRKRVLTINFFLYHSHLKLLAS